MNAFSHVPPGFRFHPTDEELVDYYLTKKVASRKIDLDVIKDVDLYKIEPWDLKEKCKIGVEEQNDWYFFSHKDKKYPTGTRTNRATTAGFWKATGRDKPIYLKNNLIGMRKTLVFYKGRAPNGQKSDWIMHEYRLETNENSTPQDEGWVVCRVFKKRVTAVRKASENESPCSWYDEKVSSFIPDLGSPKWLIAPQPDNMAAYGHHGRHHHHHHHHLYTCKSELELHHTNNDVMLHDRSLFLQLPQLESPKLPTYINNQGNIALQPSSSIISVYNTDQSIEQVTDWRVLDKFVASQLSRDVDTPKEPNFQVSDKQEAVASDYASTSNSSGQIDLWK